MGCLWIMLVTAVCFLFLLKLKWPKNKNIYSDTHCLQTSLLIFKFCQQQNKIIVSTAIKSLIGPLRAIGDVTVSITVRSIKYIDRFLVGFNRPPYYYQKLLGRARWKTRDRGSGVPGYGVQRCGKHGVWKTRGLVENTESK